MRSPHLQIMRQFAAAGCCAAAVLMLYACTAGPDASRPGDVRGSSPSEEQGQDVLGFFDSPRNRDADAGARPGTAAATPSTSLTQPREMTSTVVDARPAALINGRAVFWGDMRTLLNEAAGGEILEEIMLDMALERAMTDAGLVLSDSDIAAERTLLADTLSPDTETAMRLVDELRVRNRLGSQRFAGLLRRNAQLRALVRDQADISDTSIRAMYEMVYGTRRQVRIMMFPNLHDAEAAIRRVRAGETFADVAVELSTDSSAPRGGLLEPISRADPAYPEALRDIVWKLCIADLSSPILLDDAYAVVKLERILAQSGPPIEEVWLEMQRLARLRQERILMDQLARSLLGESTVTVLDDSLHESWNKRRAQWR